MYSNSLFHVYSAEIFNPFSSILLIFCAPFYTHSPQNSGYFESSLFSGSGRVSGVQTCLFSLSLSCLSLVSTCQWREARHRCDGGTCHSYCEFLFLCSFSLFIVLNICSHGNHSNSKTGGCIDVEDNEDDHDDDDDVINGGGEKKEQKL